GSPSSSSLFPYTTLFRSVARFRLTGWRRWGAVAACGIPVLLGFLFPVLQLTAWAASAAPTHLDGRFLRLMTNSFALALGASTLTDRKSTRLNSSHVKISY